MNPPPEERRRPSSPTGQPSVVADGSEGRVRALGRGFIVALYGAMRNIRLYPVENAVVQKAFAELTSVAESLLVGEGERRTLTSEQARRVLDRFESVASEATKWRLSSQREGRLLVVEPALIDQIELFLFGQQSDGAVN